MNPSRKSLTVSDLKNMAASEAFVSVAASLLVLKARAAAIREKVDSYVEPHFRTFGFKDKRSGEPLMKSADLHRATLTPEVTRFYADCLALHGKNGFPGYGEKCPALVAELDVMEVERALVEQYCGVAEISPESLLRNFAARQKLVTLLTDLAVNLPAVRAKSEQLLAAAA